MPALLLEIGTEEVPAGMIAAAQSELETRIRELVTRERLGGDDFSVRSFSTPRRLTALAEGVLSAQADMEEQVVGPAVKVAYKDGVATPAAMAFAKKSGVEVSDLRTIENAKGQYVTATVRRPGQSSSEVLAAKLPGEIDALHWAKNMYWRAGKPERFVRPVRWLLALLDEEVLPLEFAGVRADGVSYAHRVLHGDAPIIVRTPQAYAEKLREAYVEVDPGARRQRIRKALDAATRQIPGASWREDEALVETVTHLTEWPSVILGSFDPGYLDLPEEVLVTVMRDHQKYFALEDKNGKLLPNFLTVLNIEVDAAGAATIRHGNERVLRARFNDARFFWDVDQKIPLELRVDMLKNVTFQKDLGSYYDKTSKNSQAGYAISQAISQNFPDDLQNAIRLAKADLTTEMVKEFTELQGVVGGIYALRQGFSSTVSNAIYEHYRPQGPRDKIPTSQVGAILAIADKMTLITEMFKNGLIPSGSKDPFALRRAGSGVIRILIESDALRDRLHLITAINAGFIPEEKDKYSSIVLDFMLDRLEFYLQESCGVRLHVARAIRNSGAATGSDGQSNLIGYGYIADFARVLDKQVGSQDVKAVAELLKRTSNLLRQAGEKKIAYTASESPELLTELPERLLAERVSTTGEEIEGCYRGGQYEAVIAAIAALQPPLNAFFDSVMVLVDDPQLRDNRLALLARTEATVRWAADFSELASL